MEIVQFVDEGLGNAAHLVEVGDGVALVVDPGRDPRPYQAEAASRGLRIAWTADTHLHADFVSGSPELVADGATFFAPAAGEIDVPHRGLRAGDEILVGDLTLRALATPGHTPEALSYLLLEDGWPVALFSGGSLLVGAVARTDLITPEQTEPLARALYRSIRDELLALPDDLAVYPTHGAGSFCSAPAREDRTTTIGLERATNPLLAAPDEDAFVRALLDGLGSYPPYFLRLREVNRRGPRVFGGDRPQLARLAPDDVRRLVENGAALIDARPIPRFAEGHIPGALSIELRPAFASWLGWLVEPERPLVFVLDPDQDREELIRHALTIGFEQLAGELEGGMAAWRASGLPEARIPLVAAGARGGGTVLDVRQTSEVEVGHVPGARHVELGALRDPTGLPDGALTLMCGRGERAMTGASLLARAGRDDLTVMIGGPRDWSRATGERLETGA